MTRRIEITAFKQERILRHAVVTTCSICGVRSELLTPAEAAAIAQVETRSIYRWLGEGKTHGAKTPDGRSRICKNSLLVFSKGPKTDVL